MKASPIFALGLGYFAVQLIWSLYNAYLPLLYGRFVDSNAVIGLVMIIDNVASVTILPFFAALSDRTHTRLGRRMPFLLAGASLAAVLFALIPRAPGFVPLLGATLLMNVGVAVFSGPGMALMPDLTPPPLRGRVNGTLNFMGGLGALAAFFAVSPLHRRSPSLPFDVTAVVTVIALVVIVLTIREQHAPLPAPRRGLVCGRRATGGAEAGDAPEVGHILPAVRDLLRGRHRRVLFVLLVGLTSVAAVNGVQNMFTRYGVNYLRLDAPAATFLLGSFALAFIVFSVPAGYLGDRFDRLPVIRLGLAGTLAAFVMVATASDPGLSLGLFALGGLSWSLVVANSYPLLVNLTPPGQAGVYSGLWIGAVAMGGLIAPPVYGWVVDLLGFRAFFLPGVGFLALALLLSLGIPRSGDAEARASPAGA
ncbi:MAG: MFS transporter [Armatimonadetes bacterium]|nr:MFS transporter [Armatimonadota bacterium]